MSDTKHPMQPVEMVNGILVDQYGLNELLKQRYTDDDWSQLWATALEHLAA